MKTIVLLAFLTQAGRGFQVSTEQEWRNEVEVIDVKAKQPHVDPELRKAFEHIAEGNLWHSKESISGHGSELANTVSVRGCLGKWFQQYNIKKVVDIPCGDANWQAAIPGFEAVEYHGFDISQKAVDVAKKKNGDHANMQFGQFDLTSDVPPKADLIIVRDVLMHLTLDQGVQALKNAKASGTKWLGVTTWPDADNSQQNFVPGSFFYNNVQKTPYGFGQAKETCKNNDRKTEDKIKSAFLLFDLQAWAPL